MRIDLILTALLVSGCTVETYTRPVYRADPYEVRIVRPQFQHAAPLPATINGRPVLLQDRCSNPTVLGYVPGPDGRLYARKVCP